MRARTQRLSFLWGPALPQVPISGQGQVAGKASIRAVAVRVFPCSVYPAGAAGRAGSTEQTRDVRSAVSGHGRNLAVDCRRSQAPRSPDRLFLHPAHLGTDPHASSPPALRSPWWRNLSGRQPLGGLPSRLLLTGAGPLPPFSKPLSPLLRGILCRREAPVLRPNAAVVRSQEFRPVCGAAQEQRMGGLR